MSASIRVGPGRGGALRIRELALIGALMIGPTGAGGSEPVSPEPPDSLEFALPDSSAAPFKRKKPKVSGYVQVHYRHAIETGADGVVDNPNFRVQRVRIGIKGDVYSWLSYDVEFDPRAPQISSVLRDAYVTFRFIPRHQLRVGQQKTQFGYENRESSTRLFAVNRSEVSDALSRGVTLRDIGLGLLGNLKLGGGFRIEDAITVVNGAGMNVQDDDTRRKSVWGRLGLRYKNDDMGELEAGFGISGGSGDHIDTGDDPLDPEDDFLTSYRPLGTDLEIDHKWFFLSAEYVTSKVENITAGESDEPQGYYVNLVGKTRHKVGPIVRLDDYDDEFHRWTIGTYYGLADDPVRVLVNYEYRQRKDSVRGDDKFYTWLQVRF